MTAANREPVGEPRRDSLLDRIVGQGEPPAWWGLPIASIAGCEIRVHLVTPVLIAAALVYAFWNGPGPVFVGAGLLALVMAVLMHEACRGHALVRWAGRRPTSVTFWPLGAVWSFGDDEAERGEVTGAAVGLAALVGLAIVGALLVGFGVGDWGLLRFNPRNPTLVQASPVFASTSTLVTLSRLVAWHLYAMSLYCLAANVLPMLPLDGGVLLRAVTREPGTAPRVGLISAVVLVAGGLLAYEPLFAAIGLCGGVVCWHEWQSHRFALDPAGVDRWRELLASEETAEGQPQIPPEQREQLEAILAKISASGMGSLSRSERRVLARATEKLRSS